MIPRLAAITCTIVAVAIVLIAVMMGWTQTGAGIAAGLVIGAGNGFLIDRFYSTQLPFGATSMLRLVVMSVLVLAAVVVLGPAHAWPVVLGLGVAQLAVAGSAAYIAVARS